MKLWARMISTTIQKNIMSKKDFRVKFCGVRGSHPTPKVNFLNFGGNTACVEVNVGSHLILLDCGTGVIDVGSELMRDYILNSSPKNLTMILTHTHQDHIQGLQFFKPLHVPDFRIDIFGASFYRQSLKDILCDLLFDRAFPLSLDEIKSDLNIYDVNEQSVIVLKENGEKLLFDNPDIAEFCDDDVVIVFHKTQAHPKNGCLCVKILHHGKALVFATDKESYVGSDKRFVEFAFGADLLIHDSQYTHQDYTCAVFPKQGFGHSTFEMALETHKLAKTKKLAFFHYDPSYDDVILKILEQEFTKADDSICFSKEGMEIAL